MPRPKKWGAFGSVVLYIPCTVNAVKAVNVSVHAETFDPTFRGLRGQQLFPKHLACAAQVRCPKVSIAVQLQQSIIVIRYDA